MICDGQHPWRGGDPVLGRDLAALPSLAIVSAGMLIEATVDDDKAPHRLGPIEADRRRRGHIGRRVTVDFPSSLECATQNAHWRDLGAGRKDELKRAAREMTASLPTHATRKPGHKASKD